MEEDCERSINISAAEKLFSSFSVLVNSYLNHVVLNLRSLLDFCYSRIGKQVNLISDYFYSAQIQMLPKDHCSPTEIKVEHTLRIWNRNDICTLLSKSMHSLLLTGC